MIGDARTNKAVRTAIRSIFIMPTRRNQAATVQAATVQDVNEVQNTNNVQDVMSVENTIETQDTDNVQGMSFSWDSIISQESNVKTFDDILKECLVQPNFRLFRGVCIKNVKSFVYKAETGRLITRVTLVSKTSIPGMVVDNDDVDAFGMPIKKIGMSNNIFTSSYALAAALKNDPYLAIFADNVANMGQDDIVMASEKELIGKENIANLLLAGGKVDVLCQIIKKGEIYINPFSSNTDAAETTFDEDRIMHHIVNVEAGLVGKDLYRNYISI